MLRPQVVHETLDGETVIINLESGTYYSLEGVGADLWSRLVAGETATLSAAALAESYDADADALLSQVVAFHRALFDEGLLSDAPAPVPTAAGSVGTFESPQLQTYTDLREHLLLDPVHDVERATGWPAIPSQV